MFMCAFVGVFELLQAQWTGMNNVKLHRRTVNFTFVYIKYVVRTKYRKFVLRNIWSVQSAFFYSKQGRQ